MTYVLTLTPLSEFLSSNWLLVKHPDLYLYASLVEAEARGWNDERAALLNSRVEGILAEVNQANLIRRTAGGMRARPSIMERIRSEEHTSALQSLMRNSYAVFCSKKTIQPNTQT